MSELSRPGDQAWEQSETGEQREILKGPFFWLTAFYFIYCARTQDYIGALSHLPLAKFAGLLAALGLALSAGRTRRRFKDLPKESVYLLLLIAVLFASAFVSPVSRADALFNTLDFAKVYIAWVLTFLLVTSFARLRRIIFIQASSVAIVSLAALVKGHSVPRLFGVIGGFYSNPNDLAFGIVLSIPFCLAFLFNSKSVLTKIIWCLAILVMAITLFKTASRAGFIDLLVSGAVCLWYFGVKGKRHAMIVATLVLGVLILALTGGPLFERFTAISTGEGNAYGSYVERRMLMTLAVKATLHYPILGVGAQNFEAYSGLWRNVHVAYLQIAAEGGIPGLVFYLLFFSRGFANLKRLGKVGKLDREMSIFVGASWASLIGFVVGACFAPEVYQFFPYFTVCYTSVMLAMVEERNRAGVTAVSPAANRRLADFYLNRGRSRVFDPAR